MNKWIERIEKLLTDNNIEFEISYDYINILNSSPMTRIEVFEYKCDDIGICVAVVVQEFDELGNQTYSREFATVGKAFINRIKRNL